MDQIRSRDCCRHVVRNLAGGGVLLLDRGRNRGGILIDLLHALGIPPNGVDHTGGRGLDGDDLCRDLLGRLRCLNRERLHLRCDNSETPSRVACAGSLDGGVERQQIGLPGDVANKLHDRADLSRGFSKARDFVVRRSRFRQGGCNHLGRLDKLMVDFRDRTRQFLGHLRRGSDVARSLARGADGSRGPL